MRREGTLHQRGRDERSFVCHSVCSQSVCRMIHFKFAMYSSEGTKRHNRIALKGRSKLFMVLIVSIAFYSNLELESAPLTRAIADYRVLSAQTGLFSNASLSRDRFNLISVLRVVACLFAIFVYLLTGGGLTGPLQSGQHDPTRSQIVVVGDLFDDLFFCPYLFCGRQSCSVFILRIDQGRKLFIIPYRTTALFKK